LTEYEQPIDLKNIISSFLLTVFPSTIISILAYVVLIQVTKSAWFLALMVFFAGFSLALAIVVLENRQRPIRISIDPQGINISYLNGRQIHLMLENLAYAYLGKGPKKRFFFCFKELKYRPVVIEGDIAKAVFSEYRNRFGRSPPRTPEEYIELNKRAPYHGRYPNLEIEVRREQTRMAQRFFLIFGLYITGFLSIFTIGIWIVGDGGLVWPFLIVGPFITIILMAIATAV
jgi:hypothetical protein